MAHEKSEPKSLFILQLGIASIVILLVTRAGLISYFNSMRDQEMLTKRAAVNEIKAKERQESDNKGLASGVMPIDRAMSAVASRQRVVEPKQSNDNAAIEGWKQLPASPAGGFALPEPLPASSGGAPNASDAGAKTDASPKATGTDGGKGAH